MNSFEDRQKGFEAEFQHKQDLSFRVTARRNKLLGLWTAQRLGIPDGEAAQAYAMSVVAADFEAPGDNDVIAKIQGDLAAKGIGVTEVELRAELSRAAVEARKEIMEK
jgi:hypothetical protein